MQDLKRLGELSPTAGPAERVPALPSIWRIPGIPWLLSGGLVSMLGDQFTIIALPWLMLQLTTDPLALGAVIAAASLPRILFMPIAGLLADRFEPRKLLQGTKLLSGMLLLFLASAVLNNVASPLAVLLFAFGIGLLNAFGFPCSSAMLPRILGRDQLQSANATMMGLSQFALLGGPLVAGAIIGLHGTSSAGGSGAREGLAAVFAIDALSFLFSAWTLSMIARAPCGQVQSPIKTHRRPFGGLPSLWQDRGVRQCAIYWLACAMCVYGPLQVGLPLLAQARMAEGAAALGIMMACQGAGAMSGMLLAAMTAHRVRVQVRVVQLSAYALVAMLLVPLGFTHELTTAGVLLFMVGFFSGTVQAKVFTWIQLRIPPDSLGAGTAMFMSVMAVTAAGSGVASGWALRQVSPEVFFSAAGATLLGAVAIAASFSVFAPRRATGSSSSR